MTKLDDILDDLVKEQEEALTRDYSDSSGWNQVSRELRDAQFNLRYASALTVVSSFGSELCIYCNHGEESQSKLSKTDIEPLMLKYFDKVNEMFRRVAEKMGIELKLIKTKPKPAFLPP